MESKKPLIILSGPTASGKTKLSIALAKTIGGEIISADSMQVYRHMDIGSAKVRLEETEGVPHHLIDILEPEEEFNVVIFQKRCKEAMAGIYERGHIPILTGGTGFYIQAVLYDVDFTENDGDDSYRKELEALAERENGGGRLYEMLREADEKAAQAIHPHNIKRVIRALEFLHQTDSPISAHNEEQRAKESPYAYCYFVLTDSRERLYAGIEKRVDEMMENGLLEEVRVLRQRGCGRHMVSMQGLGYKELLACLEGEISLEEAVYRIKRDTRHFAKRQLTWFKREKDVVWYDKSAFSYDEKAILDDMARRVRMLLTENEVRI